MPIFEGTTMQPAIAYIRVSRPRQGRSGLGLEAQQAAIAAFAKTYGYRIHDVFSEVETGKGATAQLVDTDFTGADLTGCRIFGISAWRLKLEGDKQQNLVITAWNEPAITVDNIEVAQFVYLLLHNEKIRDVIDTIGKKACSCWAASPRAGWWSWNA